MSSKSRFASVCEVFSVNLERRTDKVRFVLCDVGEKCVSISLAHKLSETEAAGSVLGTLFGTACVELLDGAGIGSASRSSKFFAPGVAVSSFAALLCASAETTGLMLVASPEGTWRALPAASAEDTSGASFSALLAGSVEDASAASFAALLAASSEAMLDFAG